MVGEHKDIIPLKAKTKKALYDEVADILKSWFLAAMKSLIGPHGYLTLGSIVAVYIGYYSIIEARYERQLNSALFERANFMSMIASNNPGSLTSAMQDFVKTRDIPVLVAPSLLNPFSLILNVHTKPNYATLQQWTRHFFASCTPDVCGNPVNLVGADLRGSNLQLANLEQSILHGVNLSWANLGKAKLGGAHLGGANLIGANLSEADLHDANLSRANLSGADLSGANLLGAEELNVSQLCKAKTLWETKIDSVLKKRVIEVCPDILKEPKQ